jgi:hypothetical protein
MRALLRAVVFAAAPGCVGASPPVTSPITTAKPQQYAEPVLPEFIFTDPARREKIAATFSELDAYFTAQAAAAKIPGLAVGVVVDGELAWSKGYSLDPGAFAHPASTRRGRTI